MLTFENDPKKISLIQSSSPLSNFTRSLKKWEKDSFQKNFMKLISWHRHQGVSVNSLTSKKVGFEKMVGQKPLTIKTLGSESLETYIWICYVETRPYIFFLSTAGLSVETSTKNNGEQVSNDLSLILEKFKLT